VNFDAVAPWYRRLEAIAFGNDLQRCRVACLGEISSPRHALIVGEGNGRFLCELLRFHPSLEVDCVDASERMLRLARARIHHELLASAGRVRFLQRDIRSWSPEPRQYDLIVTHFFLDCFPTDQVAGIVTRLAGTAADNARWLLADFRVPSGTVARFRARAWLTVMYRFFRYAAGIEARELIDPSPFLRRYGFVLERQRLSRGGLLKSELWRNIGLRPVRPADIVPAASDSAE
jgi:ubiquinone/menaquinone biosynthesis C-methylase UbiE